MLNDDLAILLNTPAQVESHLPCLEQEEALASVLTQIKQKSCVLKR